MTSGKLDPNFTTDYDRYRESGLTNQEIADIYGIQRHSLYTNLRRHRHPYTPDPTPPLRGHGTLACHRRGCRCDPCRKASLDHWNKGRTKRIQLWAEGKTAPKTHNRNTYVNWGCRCETCSAEHSKYLKTRTKSRHDLVNEAPHGTNAGYTNWGCRCEPCKTAAAAHRAEYGNRK